MFDSVNNPIFIVGVVLAIILAIVILCQVIKVVGRMLFWKPKKPPKSPYER